MELERRIFMNQERIGKFIMKCRKEKKITQSDLANKLGYRTVPLVIGKMVEICLIYLYLDLFVKN